jgi:hypothetical protein
MSSLLNLYSSFCNMMQYSPTVSGRRNSFSFAERDESEDVTTSEKRRLSTDEFSDVLLAALRQLSLQARACKMSPQQLNEVFTER